MKSLSLFVAVFSLSFVFVSMAQAQYMCPDGSYVAGTRCVLTPDGRYVGK